MRPLIRTMSSIVVVALLAGACNLFYPSSASSDEAVKAATRLEGQVVAGPQCPVERADEPCPDKPFAARFEVRDLQERFVAAFRSDTEGRFSIDLAPGTYLIRPDADAPIIAPHMQAQQVVVTDEPITRVTLVFDTGLR